VLAVMLIDLASARFRKVLVELGNRKSETVPISDFRFLISDFCLPPRPA
jgi:hypothetical protein